MSVISAGTTTTTAFKVTGDTTGTLQLKTGAVPTTAIDISATQVVTFPATTTLDFTGTLLLGDGSAAAPTLAHSGDTNTGMFFPAADTIAFTEGGTEVLRLNSSAQVAVNTAGTAAAPVITKTDDLNTGIFFPAADTIAFAEGGVEALRIDSSANVGIGTSSPEAYSGYKTLEVQGSTGGVFQSSNTAGTQKALFTTNSVGATLGTITNSPLLFQTNNSEKARIDAAGNMGLGVTPSAWGGSITQVLQLKNGAHFAGAANSFAQVGANSYFDGTNYKYVGSSFASRYLQNDGTHAWYTAPSGTAGNNISFTQAMTLDASGNFSVGGTAVYNSAANRGNITIEGASTSILNLGIGGTLGGYVYHNGTDIDFRNAKNGAIQFATNGVERARITSGGDLLVSTTTAITNVKFVVGGSISCQSTNGVIYFGNAGTPAGQANYGVNAAIGRSGGTNFHIAGSVEGDMCIAPEGTKSILFGTSGSANSTTERARITSGGNFCIGTTGPLSPLNRALIVHFSYANSVGGGEGGIEFFNSNSSTDSDVNPALSIRKGSTTTSSSQRFVQFYCSGNAMGGIVGNGATNVQFVSLSDARQKTNIQSISGSLEKILALNPVSFDWIKSGEHVKAGFVAQNVEQVFPEFVVENFDTENGEPRKGLTGGMTGGIIAHLVKAIQELSAKVAALESK